MAGRINVSICNVVETYVMKHSCNSDLYFASIHLELLIEQVRLRFFFVTYLKIPILYKYD